MNIFPVLLKDGYKVGHKFQYPDDLTLVYSNYTARSTRALNSDGVINFGEQFFVRRYLIEEFRQKFFELPRDVVIRAYKRRIDNYLGPGTDVSHIGELHELGYLPLKIKSIPEGTLVPYRVPLLTIRNTDSKFGWLTNMVETLMSNILWKPITSATTALRYRRTFDKYAKLTGGDPSFVPWQGHDFSFRGMSGIEDACLSGAAHLMFFTGTDTIPAIDLLEQYYGMDCEKELIGGSVPATEHSVMSMGGCESERETIKRLITEVYPSGIVSIVCDTWDFWNVITNILPSLKTEIMTRDGKVVVRPDSGDPVKIIVGDYGAPDYTPQRRGAIRCLHTTFGGTKTASGYKQLDPHIGLIYGDSITDERQVQILNGLMKEGFASTNVVLGICSFTYEYVTRDTHGMAMKATYGETRSRGPQAIFKRPATDDGSKNSAKGLLCVNENMILEEECSWAYEAGGILQTIFENGVQFNVTTGAEIRARGSRYYQ